MSAAPSNTSPAEPPSSEDEEGLTPTMTPPTGVTPVTQSIATPDGTQPGSPKAGKEKKKKKKKQPKKILNPHLSKYDVIREIGEAMGFVEDGDEEVEKFEFNLAWSDTTLPLQKLQRLSNWQKTNHFPSMHLLCRKVHLGLTLGKLKRVFPTHYTFIPRTWSLRSERSQFARYLSTAGGRKTFILKPNAGCQGRGIILSKDPLTAVEELENYIVQEYVPKPLLIEEKKFDMRIYVLVTCVRNLSVHIYHEGLIRMCTEPYTKPSEDNINNSCMHLTNYAVNKGNENFEYNRDANRGDIGSKRDFAFFNKWLDENGHDREKLWSRIDHLICKSLIAAQPQLQHVYNSVFPHNNDGFTCFEVLGFDVLVDEKLKPWLMEVNHTPSFACDTPLDHRIKSNLIRNTLDIINVQPTDKAKHTEREKLQFQKRMTRAASKANKAEMLAVDDGAAALDLEEHFAGEDRRSVGYRRIFPAKCPERQALYNEMLLAADTVSQAQTTASQEHRQREVERERENKASKPNLNVGARGAPKEQPPRRPGGGAPQYRPLEPQMSGSSSFSRSDLLRDDESEHSNPTMEPAPAPGPAPVRPPAQAKRPSLPVPRMPNPDREKARLNEQVERHRRRMMLGPRLSVFQLRDSQLELASEILPYATEDAPYGTARGGAHDIAMHYHRWPEFAEASGETEYQY